MERKSPSGKKFRSKPQLARYLGGSMDLSTFDFRTGRMLMSKVNKSRQRMRYDSSTQVKNTSPAVGVMVPWLTEGCRGGPGLRHCRQEGHHMGKPDLNTALPVRQTASIFKQPVTKITNHPSNKVKSDPQKAVDQPRQLFWEKKLSGLNAFDIAEELVKTMDLPKGLQGVGPGCTDETLLSAIASALHTSTMPITGQLSAAVEKNPGVWLNTTQPLCKAFMVTDEDISYRLSWETVLRPTPVGQSRQRHRGSLSLWPTLSPGMEPLGADTGDVSNTSSLRRNPEERPAECFPLGFASW
ncbi:methyl-CpG-binding domain protein 3 isoform X3 [Loxodonta africana]|uniref:methyl-CpG-binding domain protein 3 isoform X3 n=1 Tax=Loxodonta africana TaxID=9785 RepID=UPI0030D4E972